MDYESKLLQEINEDRQAHGKKPFADKEDDDADPPTKEVQQSTSDPESGLFHKGEHKKDFAYVTQTACDQNGRVPGYTIHPGNEHDSRTFPAIYERLKKYDPTLMVLDAGYKTSAIAKTSEQGRLTSPGHSSRKQRTRLLTRSFILPQRLFTSDACQTMTTSTQSFPSLASR